MKTIAKGEFDAVDYHENVLYATMNGNNRTIIAIYNLNTVKLIRTFETPCESNIWLDSIQINGKYLVLGCWRNDEVYLLKLDDSNPTFDKISTNDESGFNGPNVVAIDTENNMLVADFEHHRIQMYQDGTWQTLRLEPKPHFPMAAVYVNDTLYVTGLGSDSFYISMYVIEL